MKAFEPNHERAVAAGPCVQRITCANPGPLTGAGTNTYIVGQSVCFVVDPGPADAAHETAVIEALAGRRVEAVLVTHRHRDHASGAPSLAQALGVPVMACGEASMRRMGSERLGVDTTFAPDIALADGWHGEADGARITALHTPGHASDHLCFLVETPDGDTFLSGDHVMAWSTTVIAPPYGHMGDFLASLRRLLAMDEAPLLPGHGGPVTAAHSHMRALMKHRQNREALVLRTVREGHAELAAITRHAYPELDDAMLPAAALSTLAHLEHLEEQGLVASDDGRHTPVSG